jgi:hypothetical protein
MLALFLAAAAAGSGNDGGYHPSIVPHAKALYDMAVTHPSPNPIADRVALFNGLRSHAHRRGNQLAKGRVGASLPPLMDERAPAHAQLRHRRAPPPPSTTGVIKPADFGADPTGRADSTQAMAAAVAALLRLGFARNRSALS